MDSQEAPFQPSVTDVVVDLPGWESVKPRIPDTTQRRSLERSRSIREIVFGAQDGILTTLGIIVGVGEASGSRADVLISGFLALLAGAASMAVGEYLGGKTEREVVQAAIAMEKAEMAADPQGEFAEQVAYYMMKGFSAEESQMIVRRLTQHPDIYLYEMMRDEFGIDPREAESTDLRAPLAMGGSFVLGSLLPLLPYVVPVAMRTAEFISLFLAVAGLFIVGFRAARDSNRNPFAKGGEIVAYGVVVFILSYLAGHFIPPLFGHAPVSVGG
jgi:vacuolar iron transporter family protein